MLTRELMIDLAASDLARIACPLFCTSRHICDPMTTVVPMLDVLARVNQLKDLFGEHFCW